VILVIVCSLIIFEGVNGRPVEGELKEGKGKGKRQVSCPRDPLPVGNTLVETVHDRQDREYTVHIPTRYQNDEPLALVFDIHGYTNTPETQASFSGFRDIADNEHFVVVHPRGIGLSWNGGDCCVGNNEDDVGFFVRMIDEISTTHACIDRTRVYAGGFSNGGFMSHRLACERSDLFAAIGPVAGTITVPCASSRPVPVWHIHGTDDWLIPYDGNFQYNGAPYSQDIWGDRNGCSNLTSIVYENGRTICRAKNNCDNGADATLCSVDGGSHSYDFSSRGINSAETSWEFYSQFTTEGRIAKDEPLTGRVF